MIKKIKESISIQVSKRPGRFLLIAILLFNVLFFFFATVLISCLSLSGTEDMSIIQAVFSTITMVLDPGCVSFVVKDIGGIGFVTAIVCLFIIFFGMISFTGAVIGYVTNKISSFIDDANSGTRPLLISDHIVILNWNTRASEIINDLLYCEDEQKVVVLVNGRKDEIEKEIADRLADTVSKENQLLKDGKGKSKKKFKDNLTVIVREGDVFSLKQLRDISLEKAKMVVILGDDVNKVVCKYEQNDMLETNTKGNSYTVKTLMQVADITGANYSNDNQRIIVEITDDWTRELVDRIIKCKQVDGKCNIIPVNINSILGQLFAQFSLMPELNYVYRELMSNKGATFFAKESPMISDVEFISNYFLNHNTAIPLTHLHNKYGKSYGYYVAANESLIDNVTNYPQSDYRVNLNYNYWIEHKTVIILGHNSRSRDIMEGFYNFRQEWNKKDKEILSITVIDDESSLEKMNYYDDYPFVVNTVVASIYDRDIICSSIKDIISNNKGETSILILSDDRVLNKDIDANALANLIYVQDIINDKIANEKDFDKENIDVIVEIIDPKHHDVVNSYSLNNVVISNRYVSKMITQIGEKEAIFEFYQDILSYDDSSTGFESKEVYAKKVNDFFEEIPESCTAAELIRAVYFASISNDIPENRRYPTIVLGYVKYGKGVVLFSGDLSKINVQLGEMDKLIIYSVH